MRPIIRSGNDIQPRLRRLFARIIFFTLVPVGGLVIAALIAGIIAAGVSA